MPPVSPWFEFFGEAGNPSIPLLDSLPSSLHNGKVEITLNLRAVPEQLQAQAEKWILDRFLGATVQWESRELSTCVLSMTAGECGKMSAHWTAVGEPTAPMIDATGPVLIATDEALCQMVREALTAQ
jgi:hypothetical protein